MAGRGRPTAAPTGNGEIPTATKRPYRRRQRRQGAASRSGAATGMGATLGAATGLQGLHMTGTLNLQNLTQAQAYQFGHLCELAGIRWQ